MTDQEWMNYRLEEAVWRPDRESCLQFALLKSTPGGFLAEFGVGKGETLNHIADMTDETVHGFDLFPGLSLGAAPPRESALTLSTATLSTDLRLGRAGTNGSVGLQTAPEAGAELCQRIDRCELRFAFNVCVWPGLFAQTLPIFLDEVRAPARFVHIGCALYQPIRDVLFGLEGRIGRATVVQFERLWNCWEWQEHGYRALREFACATGLDFRFLARTSGEQVAVMFR